MTEWKETTLGDICLKITDGAHHSPKEFEGGKPMFSVKNMRDQGFDYNGVKTISEEDFVKLVNSGCQPKSDDILIAKDGSVMKHVFRVKGNVDYVLLSSIAIVRPDIAKVNPSYLVYAIKDPSTTDLILNNFVGGSGVPRIVLKDFKKVDLTIPDIQTQKAIAETLSSLDDKIDLLHRQNKTLEQMAETLFRQLVEEKENEYTISQLISIQNGYAFKSKDFKETGIQGVIKIKNISGGIIDIEKTDFVENEIAESLQERFKIITGDILIAMTGAEIGKLGLIPKTNKNLWLNQRVGLLKEKYKGSKYLAYLQLKSEFGQDYIENTATGSAQPNISGTGIENCGFPKLSDEDIKNYSFQIREFYEKVIFNLGQIRTLEKMRDTILPKLMSGELTVQ